ELQLFRMALCALAPTEQVSILNDVLGRYGVSSVRLSNPDLPLNPSNVEPFGPIPSFDGPLVTVLMTSFNAGRRIAASIDSVLKQTHRNLEIIIVDDASTDETVKFIQEWIARDSRIRVISLKNNVGTYLAKSIGLQQARGEFVTCLDSDDWCHPYKISLQIAPLVKDPALIATLSSALRIHDDGSINTGSHAEIVHMNYSSL